MIHSAFRLGAALLALPGLAAAQSSFYVDFSDAAFGSVAPPASSFGAAAGIAGTWNDVDAALIVGSDLMVPALVNTAGATTSVGLNATSLSGATLFTLNFNEPNTTGDDEALMDDVFYYGGDGIFTFTNMPAGTYDVYTYAMAPDSATFLTGVDVTGSASGFQAVGGDFSAGYQLGVTHALHTVTVSAGGSIEILTSVSSGFDSINGFQVVPSGATPTLGTNYCTATVNSTGVAASISATGSSLASANNVTLMAENMPPGQFGIFVTSLTQAFAPGVGAGNLCVGGLIGRYQQPGQIQQVDPSGQFSFQIDTNFMPQGSVVVPIVPGESWNFQAWFRDFTTTPPIMGTSNLSDGLEITFQ